MTNETQGLTETIDLFDGRTISVAVNPSLATLVQPVPPDGGPLASATVNTGDQRFEVLGTALETGLQLDWTTLVSSTLTPADIYLDDTMAPFEKTPLLASLSLDFKGDLSAGLSVPVAQGLGSISASAKADGLLHYSLYRPVTGTPTGLEVLVDLLRTARLPQLVKPDQFLREQVAHQGVFRFEVDLGLKAEAGKSFSFERKVLEKLFENTALQVDATASLSAAIGGSLFERFQIAVGNIGVANLPGPGWVRLHLTRENKHGFTFGLKIALQSQYNLGSVGIQILEQVLAWQPVARVFDALQRFNQEIDPVAQGNWQAIVDKLGVEAADELETWLGIPELLQSQSVQEVLGFTRRIVETYRGLDARVRDLWQDVLFKADLQQGSKVREGLQAIAALKDQSAAQVVTEITREHFAPQVQLLEALSGVSLDELLTGLGEKPITAVQRAAVLAEQSLTFLQSFPDQVLNRWQTLAEKSGLNSVIAFLEQNATSTEALNSAIDDKLRALITRILGKAFDQIDQDDLKRLQGFASRLQGYLNQVLDLDQTLSAKLQKLNGDLGFSAGFEYGRAVQENDLLIMDFDARNHRMRTNFRHLRDGDLVEFLAGLGDATVDPDSGDLPAQPYRLIQCALVSSRTWTSSFSWVLTRLGSILGENAVSYRRFQESVRKLGSEGPEPRTGDYTGSLLIRISGKNKEEWAATAGLQAHAAGSGTDVTAAYDKVDWSLSLTSTITRSLAQNEVAPLRRLLTNFGLKVAPDLSSVLAGDGTEPRVKVGIRLTYDVTVVKAFMDWASSAEPQLWRQLYLAAGEAWYGDALVDETIFSRFPASTVLPGVVASAGYQDLLPIRSVQEVPTRLTVSFEDREFFLSTRAFNGTLIDLGLRSARGPKVLAQFGEAWQSLPAKPLPSQLYAAMAQFSDAAKKAAPIGWPEPLFLHHLILIVLARRDDLRLSDHMRGVAALRVQRGESWSDPVYYQSPGLGETESADS